MNGLVIDNFAGGGGASTGIEAAGYHVDYAINHDAAALAMHAANHPHTTHLQEDVFKVSPKQLCAGRPVALAWFSPDCKHFSKAKGGRPVSKRIRGLAWVAVRWAKEARPSVIVLENVEEFVTWGPLLPNGKPDPARKGLTFKRFVGNLRGLGYVVEWRELVAADFGAPTTRKRLFLIARCDGQPVVWPESTHRDPRKPADLFAASLQPWRTAAECIDWSLPCPSIFTRSKPLAEKTLRRVAAGVMKYVIKNASPFIVPLTHAGSLARVYDSASPLPTVTGANRGEMAAGVPTLTPFLTECANASNQRNMAADEPLRTQCAQVKGGHFAVVAGTLVGVGGRAGDSRPRSLGEPTATGTAKADVALVAANLTHFYSSNTNGGQGDPTEPLKTVTAQGGHAGLVTALLAKHYGGVVGHGVEQPIGSITSVDHHSVVEATLSRDSTEEKALRVAAFLVTYYGQGVGQEMSEPMRTITVRDRLALVTVTIGNEKFLITDISLRMLQPRELANAQGFPTDYALPGTKTSQVARIGNSVCPPVAEAIVRANMPREERMEVAG